MQSCHAAAAVDAVFDDPNLVADAGLVPVVALAEQIGLPELVAEHVKILDAANSAGAGPDTVVFVDIDSTHRRVYGYAKQGAAVGRLAGKKTLHPLIATASTPSSAPVVLAVRLRKGKAADVRGAARFLAEALTTLRLLAPRARVVVRADSQFYTADVAATAARHGASVSLTTRSTARIRTAIAGIGEQAWTAIHYPNAFVDTDTGELVSDAEVAETDYVAFTGRAKKLHVTGRLIGRRVRRLNPTAAAGQDELFTVHRHHAVFVTSSVATLQAEADHRAHAIIEQVIADAAGSALAHLPSGRFTANAAWTVLWAIAHNLTRAAGVLAGTAQARATTASLRTRLINVPARLARSARRIRLHLPAGWPFDQAWLNLHHAVHRRPHPAT